MTLKWFIANVFCCCSNQTIVRQLVFLTTKILMKLREYNMSCIMTRMENSWKCLYDPALYSCMIRWYISESKDCVCDFCWNRVFHKYQHFIGYCCFNECSFICDQNHSSYFICCKVKKKKDIWKLLFYMHFTL